MRKTLVLVLTVSIPLLYAHAVSTGVDFLKLTVGARPTGMGEAFSSVYSDITAVYWNPAGLSKIKTPQIGFMHSDAVIDASLEFFGAAYPYKDYGVFSLSGTFYIIKPIPVTTEDNTVLGELTWLDEVFTLSYSKKFYKNISFGTGLKVIKRIETDPIFGKSEGSTFAADLGVIYETPLENLNVGFASLNIGNELRMSGEKKSDALPQTTRLGLSYFKELDGLNTLLLSADFNRIIDSKWYPALGAELGLENLLFVRTGYFSKEGSIKGTTYGFGVKLAKVQVDYSNVPSSELVGYTRNNKFSVIYRF